MPPPSYRRSPRRPSSAPLPHASAADPTPVLRQAFRSGEASPPWCRRAAIPHIPPSKECGALLSGRTHGRTRTRRPAPLLLDMYMKRRDLELLVSQLDSSRQHEADREAEAQHQKELQEAVEAVKAEQRALLEHIGMTGSTASANEAGVDAEHPVAKSEEQAHASACGPPATQKQDMWERSHAAAIGFVMRRAVAMHNHMEHFDRIRHPKVCGQRLDQAKLVHAVDRLHHASTLGGCGGGVKALSHGNWVDLQEQKRLLARRYYPGAYPGAPAHQIKISPRQQEELMSRVYGQPPHQGRVAVGGSALSREALQRKLESEWATHVIQPPTHGPKKMQALFQRLHTGGAYTKNGKG